MIIKETLYHAPQPATLLRHRFMSPPPELSRLPHMERMHMQQVSDSGELDWHSHYRTSQCWLPAIASSGEAGGPSPPPYVVGTPKR